MNSTFNKQLQKLFSVLIILNVVIMAILITVMTYSYRSHYNSLINFGDTVTRAIAGSRPMLLNTSRGNNYLHDLFKSMFDTNILADIMLFQNQNTIFVLNSDFEDIYKSLNFDSNKKTVYNLSNYIILYTPFRPAPPHNGDMRHNAHNDNNYNNTRLTAIGLVIKKDSLNRLKYSAVVIIFISIMVEILIIYLYKRTKTLIAVNNEFTKKLKNAETEAATGRLSNILAHEIKNPLSSISGLISYAEKKETSETTKEILEKTQDEVNRLSTIVNDFLAYGRYIEMQVTDTDIQSIIQKTCTLLTHDADKKGITIDINDANFNCSLDNNKMLQVFVNLLLNAFDASPENDIVTININDATKVVTIANNTTQALDVDVEKLFEPFYTTKTKGSGLGLAITKKIVEAHEFSMSVDTLSPFTVSINFNING